MEMLDVIKRLRMFTTDFIAYKMGGEFADAVAGAAVILEKMAPLPAAKNERRLTKRSGEMVWFCSDCMNLEPCEMTYPMARETLRRLARYEDTQLEPEQIDQIVKAAENMMFENVGDFVRYSIANFEQLERLRKAERENKIINVPCKIGDNCWAIRRTIGGKRIFQTCVSEMYFDFHMNLIVVARRVCRGKIGKDIFLSFQEAHEFLTNEIKNKASASTEREV